MTTMTATHGRIHTAHHGFNPLKWIVNAFATHRQRIKLDELDARMLDDIGLDRAMAHRETTRPFWDLP